MSNTSEKFLKIDERSTPSAILFSIYVNIVKSKHLNTMEDAVKLQMYDKTKVVVVDFGQKYTK